MATVNLGNIKFNWKGTYNAGTAYAIDDVVSYNGSSYVCIAATTGNLPTVTAKWDVMSSAGTNGTNGTDVGTTITTQGDILYRDGSGLARLGAGTNGQLLQTGGTGANPSWTNAPVGGLVQVKFTSTATLQTLGSASFNDLTGMTLNITPTSASNKIFISAIVSGTIPTGNRGWRGRIIRAGSSIFAESGEKAVYDSASTVGTKTTYQFLDSPNSTSSTNYQIQVQQDGTGDINYQGNGISSLTLMEVSV